MSDTIRQELDGYRVILDRYRALYGKDGATISDDEQHLDALEFKIDRIFEAMAHEYEGNGNGLPQASDGPSTSTSGSANVRIVEGKGGYEYEQHADGTIVITRSPVNGTTRTEVHEGTNAYKAILAEIGAFPATKSGTPDAGKPAGSKPRKTRRAQRLEAAPDLAGDAAPEAVPEPTRRGIPTVVKVNRTMNNLEFSILLDMQIFSMTEGQAIEENKNEENRVQPLDFEITAEHVADGYVVVIIVDSSLPELDDDAIALADDAFKDLTSEEQAAINDRADELFWQMTRFEEGRKLHPSDPGFSALADSWKALRADLMQQKAQIDALPPRVVEFLDSQRGGVPVTPESYEVILKIAKRVSQMTDAQLADYKNRVEGKTRDPVDFLRDLERYAEKIELRVEATDARVAAHNELVGQKELYETWKMAHKQPHNQPHGQSDIDENAQVDAARKALPGLLKQWGYGSEEEFEKAIETYKTTFRDEAVILADEAMDYTEHALYEYEKNLSDDELNAILAQIEPHRGDMADMDTQYRKVVLDTIINKSPELQELVHYCQVMEEGSLFPLHDEMVELLYESRTAAELRAGIHEMLEERREAIDKTRQRLKEDPDLIFDFDIAVTQARAKAGVDEGGIHDAILDDEVKDRAAGKMARDLMLGLVAIIGGFMAAGPAGSAAAAGAVASITAGAAGAWISYSEYATEEDAFQSGMSSSDPSFAWVVVELMTIPLDVLQLADVAKAMKASKQAAAVAAILGKDTKLGEAVRDFNKAQDTIESVDDAAAVCAKLESDLAAAKSELGKAYDEVSRATLRAARAEAEANAAWNAARKAHGGKAMAVIDPVVSPIAVWLWHFAYPICNSLRQGIREVDKMLKLRRVRDLLGEIDSIQPEGINNLKEAFYRIETEDWARITKRALELEIEEDTFADAFMVWGRDPKMKTEEFITKVLEPMAAKGPVATIATKLYAQATDDRLGMVLEAMPKSSPIRGDLMELRREIRKAISDHEAGVTDAMEFEAQRKIFETRLRRFMDDDPLLGEVMSLSDDVFEGLGPARAKQMKKLISESVDDAYENGSTILEEFAERQRNARADGDIEQILYNREVGERLTRIGTWSEGVPGHGKWIPERLDVQKNMLEYYLKVKDKYPDLEFKDFEEIPFVNGYPDFSKYIEGGWEADSPGRVMLPADDFKLPKYSDDGTPLTKKQAKSKLREAHFKAADKAFAERMNKQLGLDEWDPARVAAYRQSEGLTWHHVENSTELQLVPSWLHGHIGHEGGVATGGGL